jgi:hypothetical protein
MKKATSILFALLTLLGSVSPGIAYHYCSGELAQATIYYGNGNADCNMGCTTSPPLKSDQNHLLNPAPCCTNDFTELDQGEYTFSKLSYSLTSELKPFLTPGISDRTTLQREVYNKSKFHSIPPPLFTEVSLPFIQVFII